MQLSLGSVTSKPCEATAAENYSDRIFALTPSASSVAVTEGKDNVFQMCFVRPEPGHRIRTVHRRAEARHQDRDHLEER